MGVSVVWFKKDLRISDHLPLRLAAESGKKVRCIYIFEPSIWQSPDFDPIHDQFIRESLNDLHLALQSRGGCLEIHFGEAIDIFLKMHTQVPINSIFSHEETGNGLSYARDRAIRKWAKFHRVEWIEVPTNGVIRKLSHRNGWARTFEKRMAEPLIAIPENISCFSSDEPRLPQRNALGLENPRKGLQTGGITAAKETLDSFLTERGLGYSGGISSPLTAVKACSRLSPYLAFGNMSVRQVIQASRNIRGNLDAEDTATKQWSRSIRAFEERLHWRCHFIQKLESEPEIEDFPFVRSYIGLRENDLNLDYLQAWQTGQTGYPMIDACMRSMIATGWLNFRMRAMITAFASYQLWLHWKPTALFAARQWLDYEPGIHYSQFQMQSGTTGINTLRIYNPIKQSQDHDPNGQFIRQWIPELRGVTGPMIHTPWLIPDEIQASIGMRIGRDYPRPIVDHLGAVALAKSKISVFRHNHPEIWGEIHEVREKHGSRRKSSFGRSKTPAKPVQSSLFD